MPRLWRSEAAALPHWLEPLLFRDTWALFLGPTPPPGATGGQRVTWGEAEGTEPARAPGMASTLRLQGPQAAGRLGARTPMAGLMDISSAGRAASCPRLPETLLSCGSSRRPRLAQLLPCPVPVRPAAQPPPRTPIGPPGYQGRCVHSPPASPLAVRAQRAFCGHLGVAVAGCALPVTCDGPGPGQEECLHRLVCSRYLRPGPS